MSLVERVPVRTYNDRGVATVLDCNRKVRLVTSMNEIQDWTKNWTNLIKIRESYTCPNAATSG